MTAKVICLGIAVLDRVFELAVQPDGPGKYLACAYRETGGGMAATAAVAVASLGGHAAWCGHLGEDAAGAALLAAFAKHSVDASGAVRTPASRTPTAGVFVSPDGERMLAVFPGAGMADDPGSIAARLESAGAALADPRWIAGAQELFTAAASRNLPRVLDADNCGADALRRLAPLADHVIFSKRGLTEFAAIENPHAALRATAAELHGAIAVTLGAEGSLWVLDGTIVPVSAPRVAARDTTGCGDVFHGAYALAIAEGTGVLAAARFATAAAALKAQRGEGWDGMPDRRSVEELLQENWE